MRPPLSPPTESQRFVRALLPEKLPRGWSPPAVVEESGEGWAMLVDDRVVIAMLVMEEHTLRLWVTILANSAEDPVGMHEALEVLLAFRGEGEFRQSQGEEELEGGRSFVADVHGAEGGTLAAKGSARETN